MPRPCQMRLFRENNSVLVRASEASFGLMCTGSISRDKLGAEFRT